MPLCEHENPAECPNHGPRAVVTAEPRMELLPDEWQALADLEQVAREVASLAADGNDASGGLPVFAGFHVSSWGAEALVKLRGALAELDKVRGRVASVDGDRIREDERVQEARFREHG